MRKLDFESIGEWMKRRKRTVVITALVVLLLFLASFAYDSCGNWKDKRTINRLQTNINAFETNANNNNK